MNLQGARYGHSAGKQKILRLERELSKLRATSLEQLQEQVRQKVLLPCPLLPGAWH